MHFENAFCFEDEERGDIGRNALRERMIRQCVNEKTKTLDFHVALVLANYRRDGKTSC